MSAATAGATAARPRHLALLVKRFPKLSETFVLEEVLGLERLGVPLRLYALAPPSDTLVHDAVARVQAAVVQVPARLSDDAAGFARHHLALALAHPLRWLGTLGTALRRGRTGARDFARAGWLAGRLRADGVLHLHTHFISEPADVAELAAQLGGLPFSISAHAKDIYRSAAADLRRKMQAARFTVTCTAFNARTLQTIAPAARVRRMYHGIDAAVFHPSRRALAAAGGSAALVPRILSIGRLVEKKGLDTLVDACRQLADRGLPFRCEIVGYGEQHAALAARIAATGLGDRVHLVGTLVRDGVIERLAATTVYVQPSRVAADGDRDGIPNVLLEAMALGLPVVATNVSGIPEVVEHEANGLLVEPDAPAALADAIERVLLDAALRQRLGTAARRTVTDHFDNDRNLRVVLQLLETGHEPAEHRAVA